MNTSIERAFVIAWALGCCFYFMEYVVRSSPAVMIGELAGRLDATPLVVSGILGAYYYTYSVTSLVAGVALDHAGAKYPVSIGIGILALGCLLFALPAWLPEEIGRLCQGAGSAFAFTGCVYMASHGFSPRVIATAIGVTQCIGMLGGSVGQFVVGPMIHHGVPVGSFWIGCGIICAGIGLGLLAIIPREGKALPQATQPGSIVAPYKIVFSNPQSWLSGVTSGLLFAPTTIFAMTWGVAFFMQDLGFPYSRAVTVCGLVPGGWVIGCPLLGWLSDRWGLRKPALSGGILVMLASFASLMFLTDVVPPEASALVFGIASGAAMIPYTIIKEANPEPVKGSATGGINFITFSVTALLGPWFAGWYGRTLAGASDHAAHFRGAGLFFLVAMAVALGVSVILRETGHKKKVSPGS
jgi:MFS family permease